MTKGNIKESFKAHIIKGNSKLSTELKVPYGGWLYEGKFIFIVSYLSIYFM